MLQRLKVTDFAVLAEVELDFTAGFTALTGETGAGKSMLVDALALALGERADASAVRSGRERAEVVAQFLAPAPGAARRWLTDHDLNEGDECTLRRVVTAEGRSRAYINGRPATLEQLREVGGLLVEICGQHAHQSLLRRPAQRALLDASGEHGELLLAAQRAYQEWSAAGAEHARLVASQQERADRVELQRYQVRELQGLAPGPGEYEALEDERLVLANVGRIAAGLAAALEACYDHEEASAQSATATALRALAPLATLDGALVEPAGELEQATIHLREAADLMRRRLHELEHDPERLRAVEQRLGAMDELARKHRVEPTQLCQRSTELAATLAGLTADDDRLAGMTTELAARRQMLATAQAALTAARQRAGRKLADKVTRGLRGLGMADARFAVQLAPLALEDSGPAGAEDIDFLISAGAGQQPGPIARVASGGELSRLSLALRVAALDSSAAPTLIFDEVDAGTGGGVAEIVGQSLRALAGDRQVLCVTHLPQVASQADQHCVVAKSKSAGAARTTVAVLDEAGRVEEIARMLGGLTVTERARAHAREMLQPKARRRTG